MATYRTAHASYASLDAMQRGDAMSPRELVEDALRSMTDGSMTFRLEEDAHTVVAATSLDGRLATFGWSKAELEINPDAAKQGVRDFFKRLNHPDTLLNALDPDGGPVAMVEED